MTLRYKVLLIILLSIVMRVDAQLQDMFDLGGGLAVETEQKQEAEVSVKAMHEVIGAGQATVLAVVIDIPKNEHLYANPNDGGIGLPTELKVEPVEGLEFGDPVYPKGHEYKDQLGNIDMVYAEEAAILLPVKNVGVAAATDLDLSIKLDGQICTDGGQCFRWKDEAGYTLRVDPALDGKSAGSNDEIFSGVDADAYFKGEEVAEGAAAVETEQWVIVNILFAMLAGFIMNFMPCVLPVIPLKVLSIIKQGQQAKESGDNYKALKLSLVFAAGIIVLFAILGLLMSGLNMFYGQQFQNFAFKMSMFLLVYVMALSMFGLFEIMLPSSISNIGVVKDGYLGSFMMGIMATLLATPCSAPFLGGVLPWALKQPEYMTLLIFVCIGIGMAAPYILLTAFPKLLDNMPTAGNWMLRLKEGLAFVMLGVAVYMSTWFKANEIAPLLALCVAIAFGLWMSFKLVNFTSPPEKKLIVRLIAIGVIALTGYAGFGNLQEGVEDTEVSMAQIVEAREQALADGKVVFMEFTADWCPNCIAVERAVLKRDKFTDKMKEVNAKMIIVDMTHDDEEKNAELERLGSASIPFAAVFHPDKPEEPILLRDIYTMQAALDALDGKR